MCLWPYSSWTTKTPGTSNAVARVWWWSLPPTVPTSWIKPWFVPDALIVRSRRGGGRLSDGDWCFWGIPFRQRENIFDLKIQKTLLGSFFFGKGYVGSQEGRLNTFFFQSQVLKVEIVYEMWTVAEYKSFYNKTSDKKIPKRHEDAGVSLKSRKNSGFF